MAEFGINNEKGFPSSLKHEFKNMLNPVINLSSVLIKTASEKLSPEEVSYLGIILKNGKEMLSIIDGDSMPVKEGDIYANGKSQVPEEYEYIMLVIDDEPDNLIAVRAILEHDFNNAFKVIHARNGKEGIDILSKQKPDIILLDINLPDINGFSLVKNIKNFFAGDKVPVIAFTALDISEYKTKIISSGFDDIIPKPFEIESFVEKIKKWSGDICL